MLDKNYVIAPWDLKEMARNRTGQRSQATDDIFYNHLLQDFTMAGEKNSSD